MEEERPPKGATKPESLDEKRAAKIAEAKALLEQGSLGTPAAKRIREEAIEELGEEGMAKAVDRVMARYRELQGIPDATVTPLPQRHEEAETYNVGFDETEDTWTVTWKGEPTKIRPGQAKALAFLMEHPGTICSVEDLCAHTGLTPISIVAEMPHLRRMLEVIDPGHEGGFIKAIAGEGYQYVDANEAAAEELRLQQKRELKAEDQMARRGEQAVMGQQILTDIAPGHEARGGYVLSAIDPKRYSVKYGSEESIITPAEAKILALLMQHEGTPVSINDLCIQAGIKPSTLKTSISHLPGTLRAIDSNGHGGELVFIKGEGYKYTNYIRRAEEALGIEPGAYAKQETAGTKTPTTIAIEAKVEELKTVDRNK